MVVRSEPRRNAITMVVRGTDTTPPVSPDPVVFTNPDTDTTPTPVGTTVPNVLVQQGRSMRTATVFFVGRVGEGELHVLAPVVLRENTPP
jgi:hypothetical protein